MSLEKFNLEGFSDDPINWMAGSAGGSPGTTPDGLFYQLWALQNFTPEELAQSGLTGCDDDINGDGYPNLFAYAFGYDPHTSPTADLLPRSVIVDDGGSDYLAISFRMQQDATDLSYVAEYSSDLTGWMVAATEGNPAVDNGDGTDTVEIRSDVPIDVERRQFLRLNLSKD